MILQDPLAQQHTLSAYLSAEQALQAFLQQNHDLVEELRALTAARNRTLTEVEHAARAAQMDLGPVRKSRPTTRVDTGLALQTLGKHRFLEAGGVLVEEPKISAEAVRQAVQSGIIQQQEASSFCSANPTFSVPPTYKVP